MNDDAHQNSVSPAYNCISRDRTLHCTSLKCLLYLSMWVAAVVNHIWTIF